MLCLLSLRVISFIVVQRIPSPADQQQPQAQQLGQLFRENGLNGDEMLQCVLQLLALNQS